MISIILWTMCAFAIISNALVIAVFVIYREVRDRGSNLYILNLAICDFIIGIIIIPFHNVYRFYGIWPFGEAFCKLYIILDWTSSVMSVWAIVLISYDRFVLVTKGLEYDKIQTRRKFLWLTGTLWSIYFLRYAIPIIGYDILLGETWVDYSTTCDTQIDYILGYFIFSFVTSLCLPVLLIAVFNVIVYANIRRRSRGLPRNWASSNAVRPSNSSAADPNSCEPSSATGSETPGVPRREGTSNFRKLRRSAITLALIVGVSALCWTPYYISIVLGFFNIEVKTTISIATYYIWWSNCVWDPLLYVVTNPGIRNGLAKILHIAKK